jgi:hypothetical protein
MPERPASPKLRKKPPIPPYAGVVGIGVGGTGYLTSLGFLPIGSSASFPKGEGLISPAELYNATTVSSVGY